MPGATKDQLIRDVVGPWPAREAVLHGPEAERPAVMRAAVAHAAKLVSNRDDADLTSFHTGNDMAVPLEIGERADVVPGAHAAATPRRSP